MKSITRSSYNSGDGGENGNEAQPQEQQVQQQQGDAAEEEDAAALVRGSGVGRAELSTGLDLPRDLLCAFTNSEAASRAHDPRSLKSMLSPQ